MLFVVKKKLIRAVSRLILKNTVRLVGRSAGSAVDNGIQEVGLLLEAEHRGHWGR